MTKSHIVIVILILTCVLAPLAGGQVHDDHSLNSADGSFEDAVFVDNKANLGLKGNIDGRRPGGVLAIHANGWSQGGSGIELYGNGHERGGGLALVAGPGQGNAKNAFGITFGNYTGTSWRQSMVIKNTGMVGIGTNDPVSMLQVGGGVTARALNVFSENNTDPRISFRKDNAHFGLLGFEKDQGGGGQFSVSTTSPSGSIVPRLTADSSGNVGVGTTDPAALFHVQDGRVLFKIDYGEIRFDAGPPNPAIGSNIWDIHFWHPSVGHNRLVARKYMKPSDRKLKTDVVAITGALDKVKRLRGVYFKFKSPAAPTKEQQRHGRELGFIAQEVEKVLPEAVSDSAKGFKAISYDDFMPLVVEAIKEQQRMIDRQQATIARLVRVLKDNGMKVP